MLYAKNQYFYKHLCGKNLCKKKKKIFSREIESWYKILKFQIYKYELVYYCNSMMLNAKNQYFTSISNLKIYVKKI